MNYFSKAKELRAKALKDTEEREKRYAEQIAFCSKNTRVITSLNVDAYEFPDVVPTTEFKKMDTVSAAFDESPEKSIAVLNFASYRNPGGMYIAGSSAQEESLCHESFLYNVLKRQTSYYDENEKYKNRGLYTNRALVSPNVHFFHKGEERLLTVITCAAPNKSLLSKYQAFSEKDALSALKSRISFVCKIIRQLIKVDTVILGAFGCGVFKNDPKEVAGFFKHFLATTSYPLKVIYAIPDDKNFSLFKEGYNDPPMSVIKETSLPF